MKRILSILLCLYSIWEAEGVRSEMRMEPAFEVGEATANQREPLPLRWGFDDIGFEYPEPWHEASLIRHPKGKELMDELGFDFWLMWYPDQAGKWSYEKNIEFIRSIDAWCAKHEMEWMVNTLPTVWNNAPEHCLDEHGHDWFCRADGRRFLLFPEELLKEFSSCRQLLGLMYDEAEHHQNNANQVPGLNRPSLYDPAKQELKQAADGHSAAVAEMVAYHAKFGLKLHTEHVTPVMYHTFARGGMTAGTKVLKESWSPVMIACALGAAIQYNTPLWITPDLWGLQGYPSHSPDEYRSALLLAYHLGADCIYTESLSLAPLPNSPYPYHSLAKVTAEDYTLTPYGEIAKQFIHDYVPAHPRYFRRQELKPRVVIIRQEDGCYGQRSIQEAHLPDRLFGSQQWHSSEETEAWLAVWHLLTNGVVPADRLYRSWNRFASVPYQVLCPLDGVVVYDHHAGYELLQDAEVIFLVGIGVSEGTQQAIRKCVKKGATCVALPELAPEEIQTKVEGMEKIPEGRGCWILTRDFLNPSIREAVAHVLPRENRIRYRFGNQEIIFQPIDGDLNRLECRVGGSH